MYSTVQQNRITPSPSLKSFEFGLKTWTLDLDLDMDFGIGLWSRTWTEHSH